MPEAFRLTFRTLPRASPRESLAAADVLGQLLRREGRMRDLGTENGDVKLDWVDGVEKALGRPEWLAAVEGEAADIVRAGIRHIIWAGMGGSVQTVYALERLGSSTTARQRPPARQHRPGDAQPARRRAATARRSRPTFRTFSSAR